MRGGVDVSELVGAAARRGRIGGAPQEGDDLRAGAALLRGEGGGGSALGDVEVHGPLDGIIEVVAGSHVDKVHGLFDLDGERALSLLAGLGAVGGEGDIDDIADLGKLGGHISHVVEVIVLAAGLGVVVELVLGADGGVDAGAAVVVTVERAGAVEVGGDGAVLAHIEGDIVEVSLLVALVGIAQEVDELVGAELDRAVHADLKDDVFLDNGDHNLAGHADLLVDDLVVLVVLLGIQGEGNLDGVLGLGDGLEGHLVEIFNLSGGLDLVLALVEDTLSGGVGQGVELDILQLEVVASVGVDVVIGVVVHEGLESLLVEGNALACDHAVLDSVGLLGNFNRTGGSNAVLVKANNIEGHSGLVLERGSGNGDGLVLLDGAVKFADLAAAAGVVAVVIGYLGGGVIEILIVGVGERNVLVGGVTGHGLLDVASRDNRNGERDRVGLVIIAAHSHGHRGITNETCGGTELKTIILIDVTARGRDLIGAIVEHAALVSCGRDTGKIDIAVLLNVDARRERLIGSSFQIIVVKLKRIAVFNLIKAGAEQFAGDIDRLRIEGLALIGGLDGDGHCVIGIKGNARFAGGVLRRRKRHNAAFAGSKLILDLAGNRSVSRPINHGGGNRIIGTFFRKRNAFLVQSQTNIFVDDLIGAGRFLYGSLVVAGENLAGHSSGTSAGGIGRGQNILLIAAVAGINTIIHIPLIGGILNARGRCGQFQSATLENFVVFADLLNTASDGDAGLAGNNDLSGSAFDGRANSLATDFNGNGAASRHGLRRAGGVGQLLTDTLAAAGNAAPSILQSVILALSKGYFFGIAGLAHNGNIPVNGEVNRGIMLDIRNILAVNLCLDSERTSDAVSDIGSSDGDLSGQRLGNGIRC